MLNNKDYCDHETYEALKELGMPFYAETLCYQKDGGIQYTTPRREQSFLLYEAQKWLREKMSIQIEIPTSFMDNGVWKFNFRIQTPEFYDRAIGEWDSYEEALLEGIKQAIKILKGK